MPLPLPLDSMLGAWRPGYTMGSIMGLVVLVVTVVTVVVVGMMEVRGLEGLEAEQQRTAQYAARTLVMR